MQKIAANYVSGFIILMDRSVSIGDQVTVDRHTGELTRMTARYVVVRNPDGTEAIIPNETIISSTVINHSYSDRRVRVPVQLQVGYRTDLDLAARIMEDAARRHPRVLRDPEARHRDPLPAARSARTGRCDDPDLVAIVTGGLRQSIQWTGSLLSTSAENTMPKR